LTLSHGQSFQRLGAAKTPDGPYRFADDEALVFFKRQDKSQTRDQLRMPESDVGAFEVQP